MSGLFINLFAVEIQTGRQKDIKCSIEMAGVTYPPPPPKKKKKKNELYLSSTVDGDMNLKP